MTLGLAVFSFWWVQKKRLSQGTKFILTFSWSILVTHWLSISQNFQMERQTFSRINNSNSDSNFWYELSLLQWLIPISGTWAGNAMCSFSVRLLLMQSKDGLIVIRRSPNTFLCSKSKSIDSALWIMKMIFQILPQFRSHCLCQLSLTLVTLRYVS